MQNLALVGVQDEDAGVASAVINSVFHIGGSIGLALFTVFYANVSNNAFELGVEELTALTDGHKAAFAGAGADMAVTAIVPVTMICGKRTI